jgi:hypothetical protein
MLTEEPEPSWSLEVHLGELVGEHHDRVADHELRVADLAAGSVHAQRSLGTEDLL